VFAQYGMRKCFESEKQPTGIYKTTRSVGRSDMGPIITYSHTEHFIIL